MEKQNLTVEYYCDLTGDHTVDNADCITTGKRTFKTREQMLAFVDECTHVINLDEIFDVPQTSKKASDNNVFRGIDEF